MNPVKCYLLATRPAFLLAVVLPVMIGSASAWAAGVVLDGRLLLLTLGAALLIHAAANVLNDYYDARNGTDALNRDFLSPYTGGSRFIQNGLLTPRQTLRYGLLLLSGGSVGGLWLVLESGWGLLGIGMAGVLGAWAYSAPPLDLNRHGLGEIAIALTFGPLTVAGSDYVQRQLFDWQPWLLALPYGLLCAALLYINQFPDRRADTLVGKRHWVVRLGTRRARWGYAAVVLGAYLCLALLLWYGVFPPAYGLALLAAPLSLLAAVGLWRHAHRPARLLPAIRLTLAALWVHALLLVVGIAMASR